MLKKRCSLGATFLNKNSKKDLQKTSECTSTDSKVLKNTKTNKNNYDGATIGNNNFEEPTHISFEDIKTLVDNITEKNAATGAITTDDNHQIMDYPLPDKQQEICEELRTFATSAYRLRGMIEDADQEEAKYQIKEIKIKIDLAKTITSLLSKLKTTSSFDESFTKAVVSIEDKIEEYKKLGWQIEEEINDLDTLIRFFKLFREKDSKITKEYFLVSISNLIDYFTKQINILDASRTADIKSESRNRLFCGYTTAIAIRHALLRANDKPSKELEGYSNELQSSGNGILPANQVIDLINKR